MRTIIVVHFPITVVHSLQNSVSLNTTATHFGVVPCCCSSSKSRECVLLFLDITLLNHYITDNFIRKNVDVMDDRMQSDQFSIRIGQRIRKFPRPVMTVRSFPGHVPVALRHCLAFSRLQQQILVGLDFQSAVNGPQKDLEHFTQQVQVDGLGDYSQIVYDRTPYYVNEIFPSSPYIII